MSPVHTQETAQGTFAEICEEAFKPVAAGLDQWSKEVKYAEWNVNGVLLPRIGRKFHELRDHMQELLHPDRGYGFYRDMATSLWFLIRDFEDAFATEGRSVYESALAEYVEQLDEFRVRFQIVFNVPRIPRHSNS